MVFVVSFIFQKTTMEHLGVDPRLDLKDGEIGGDDWLMTLRRYQSTTRWFFLMFPKWGNDPI